MRSQTHPITSRLLAWFNFLISLRLYQVFAVVYFTEITRSFAGALSIVAIAQGCQAALDAPTGIFSDRIGRRPCLILGALCSFASVGLYATGHVYGALALGGALQGASQALFSGINNALLYESLAASGDQCRYPGALGTANAWAELAFFASGVLGGLIAARSYALLFWLTCVPQAAALAVALRFTEPPNRNARGVQLRDHLRGSIALYRASGKLRLLSLAGVIGTGVGDAAWSLFPVFFLSLLPVWLVGFVVASFGLVSAAGYRLSARLLDRLKPVRVIVGGHLSTLALNVLAFAFPTAASPVILAIGSASFAPGEVAKNHLLQEEFTDSQRATMASINSTCGNALQAVCAVLLGLLADRAGPAKALLSAQFALLPVVLLYLAAFRQRTTGHPEPSG